MNVVWFGCGTIVRVMCGCSRIECSVTEKIPSSSTVRIQDLLPDFPTEMSPSLVFGPQYRRS